MNTKNAIAVCQPDEPLLAVADLCVSYRGERESVDAVRSLSFELGAGETLGIVGESGSGKTQTALALMGLLPATARVSGTAHFEQRDLLALTQRQLNTVRGNSIAMIFQDPMTALNPHLTIGRQMARVLERHQGMSRRNALTGAASMLDAVRVPEARARLKQYPHEMSGGMRQRIMIATALLCRPALLVADEPTTALDVTVQAQILELMQELQHELGTAILFITHDMGVVASVCDRVLVMCAGELRETGTVAQVFYTPADKYTRELLAAVPRLDAQQPHRLAVVGTKQPEPAPAANANSPGSINNPLLLAAEDIRVVFDAGRATMFGPRRELKAVDGASFELRAGETLGVVGESGCGKSTLARAVLQLLDQYTGRVSLLGCDLARLSAGALKQQRQNMQVVFQDPLASLDPRMTIGDIVGEPLRTFRPDLSATERLATVQALLAKVGLEPGHVYRYPHEFSGGQCQRIGIARALIAQPKLIICDEPVSALDVSVQAQIINLLMDLQQEMGLALVFIAHDLAVVRHISHRVMVMYLGRIVEAADRDTLYESPRHPYTKALISAVPIPDPELERARDRSLLRGDLPSPLDPPSGCSFRTRCPLAEERCAAEKPELRTIGRTLVACHYAD
jgi:oligopeptide/dipeptide ABC transporter ATP-binding protein